jgi:hypothetical protein
MDLNGEAIDEQRLRKMDSINSSITEGSFEVETDNGTNNEQVV